MSFFKLNLNRCKRDGICSAVCVAGIIKVDDNRIPYINEKSEKYCIACGQCVAFCPHNACSVSTLNELEFKQFDKKELPTANSVDTLLRSRRTIRRFKKELISHETLKDILNSTRYAPSAENVQKVRWIGSKSIEETEKLGNLVAEYFEEKAKTIPTPESNLMKGLVKAYKQGRDPIMRSAPQIIIAVLPKDYQWKEDASIALTYLEISAYAHGVGTCWAGYFTSAARNYNPLKKALKIHENEYIVGAQLIGYPIYKQKTIPSRKSLNMTWL